MIHVILQEEPLDFDAKVRHKGRVWFSQHNIDSKQQLPPGTKLPPYWRNFLSTMRQKYRFCAFTNILIGPKGGTVDHYLPKSKYPDYAYEWNNYRLALSSINACKKDKEGILDPCTIRNGWFWLNVVTGLLCPSNKVSMRVKQKVADTIDRLRLNDSDYVRYRKRYIEDFINHDISISVLKRDAPYIYFELNRQHLL